MLDALVGAFVIAVATSSLVLALQVAEKAFRSAGCYPITENERLILERISTIDSKTFSEENLEALPKQASGRSICQDGG